jgi:hypothetical protein
MRMWRSICASVLDPHAHEEAYAVLVLSSGYEEAGDRGRLQVKAGDIIFHGQFEAHLDRLLAVVRARGPGWAISRNDLQKTVQSFFSPAYCH